MIHPADRSHVIPDEHEATRTHVHREVHRLRT